MQTDRHVSRLYVATESNWRACGVEATPTHCLTKEEHTLIFGEVSFLVLKSFVVIPKVCGHGREGLCAHQLTTLILYSLPWETEHSHFSQTAHALK